MAVKIGRLPKGVARQKLVQVIFKADPETLADLAALKILAEDPTVKEGQRSAIIRRAIRELRERMDPLKARTTPSERDEVYALVLAFLNGDAGKAELWMKVPNPMLGGITPDDLLALRPGKVLKIVKQALAENER